MKVPVVFKEWELTAFLAGLTAFTYYAFGALPLHIAVSQQLGLSPSQTSSWVFIVWFNGAVWSIFLCLFYRQPIPITWTLPGLIYLGTLAGQFSFAEIIGGNLMAGVLILVLALMRMGERIMKWLPLPIVMGMFAGSIFIYVTRTVSIIVEDLAVAGVTVAGYLLGRFIGSRSLPPVALAVICGSIAVGLSADLNLGALPLTLPRVGIPEMQFSFAAFIAISLPLVVLAMGLGNVQGLGFLLAQGYPAPINVLTVVTGICSIVNAVFGGHPATVARIGVALLAGPEAGPPRSRYWGGVTAAALTIMIALASSTVAALVGVLPRGFIIVLAGVAILSAFQDALEKAFGGHMRFGALTAFAVAATPFAILGITSAFWAILAGLAGSLLAERGELFAYWKGAREG
ncbi:MAG: benzoate/H(+) symporter BenE family transporter [SAR324 cluster bacterium]|nr:benzoate/H(+) symporter BenE family transporter [SAR324 cluster bacterium]MCZ6533104.1 benzoate/H(+) symporter BenE family transporter [SAR324 cluster bacterium]MCZ6844197.1 benzoate/H(+) symporter BenE family transporter [SAR324 cluster bacterium]